MVSIKLNGINRNIPILYKFLYILWNVYNDVNMKNSKINMLKEGSILIQNASIKWVNLL